MEFLEIKHEKEVEIVTDVYVCKNCGTENLFRVDQLKSGERLVLKCGACGAGDMKKRKKRFGEQSSDYQNDGVSVFNHGKTT